MEPFFLDPFPSTYVLKSLPLRFDGVDLAVKVSHALFSSHQIDEGTLLLLKTLAQKRVEFTGKALDCGCGAGPLALALAKRYTGLSVEARDRSLLACSFTAENARVNHLTIDVKPALLGDAEEQSFDVVVANIPAKAGAPVLRWWWKRLLALVVPEGVVAVVVVAPLAEATLRDAQDAGWVLDLHERTLRYAVYHFRRPAGATVQDDKSAYQRCQQTLTDGRSMTTVWGLPNFDSIDYPLQTQARVLENLAKLKVDRVLVWEPGQGHSALMLKRGDLTKCDLTVAGTDLLALRATQQNVSCSSLPVADFALLSGHLLPQDLVVMNWQSHPRVPWISSVQQTLKTLLSPRGRVVISGTSTDMSRFLEQHRGFRLLDEARWRGFRSLVLENQ
ncbi:MAG: methyltransferase [Spirochaetales bacterium]|nr:methyltransferase [Spirochaetales bacterium]